MDRVRPDVDLTRDIVFLQRLLIRRISLDEGRVERAMVYEYRRFDFRHIGHHRIAAIEWSNGGHIWAHHSRQGIAHAAAKAEAGCTDLAGGERMCPQPLRGCEEILNPFARIDLPKQLTAPVVVVGISTDRRQRIGRKCDEVLQCEPPCDVFGMGIQPAVLVYDKNGRQLGRCFGTAILAEWPDEVAPDVAISIGRRYGLVARLDSLVVFANLLP